MTNPTSNFGWQMPTSTDLVTDLPADFETFGQAVDTSFADLKGGTTGQVLSKASNTDMDFTWVAQDDSNAIQNAIVDAKGDLIAASAADTPARLAVGNNGETLVADSSTSTGLRYQGNYAAGKNKCLNSDYSIWQRGTSGFTNGSLTADRWYYYADGTGTRAVTRETFTPGTAPVSGYEGKYYWRMTQSVAGTGGSLNITWQRIEDVQTFAGQTITVSFWAKADAARTISVGLNQNFGSGGSSAVAITGTNFSATTAWTRFSYTVAIPSIAGKTVGTSSYFEIQIGMPLNVVQTIDIWGVQAEIASVATSFQTATGTIQGELAACQRYYWRFGGQDSNQIYGLGIATGITTASIPVQNPVTMRTAPTSIDFSTLGTSDLTAFTNAITTLTISVAASNIVRLSASGGSGMTTKTPVTLQNTAIGGYLGISAEL